MASQAGPQDVAGLNEKVGAAMCQFATHYFHGDSVDRDVDKAVSLWEGAARLRHPQALAQLAWCHHHGVGVDRDLPRAVSLYEDAISLDKTASWRLGVCYLHGHGVDRDWARAADLMQQSGNDPDAVAYLGWCYLWGCGVERDEARAVELLSSGASSGCARAAVFLGYCRERGIGVARDVAHANALYAGGKEVPDGRGALGELGEFCQRGDCGAPVDKRAAVGYFRMGAEGGDPVSMFHLGVCLRDAVVGVDCDREQSHHWLEKAAQFGHKVSFQIKTLGYEMARNMESSYQLQNYTKEDLSTSSSMDFGVWRFLGSNGSNGAVFKVQYHRGQTELASTPTSTSEIALKVLFNWANTPQQMMLRHKYNAEFVESHRICLFKHIESQSIVHRNIKEDNIMVDPESGKLTLIDFGEAQHCQNMDVVLSPGAAVWGNTGTMPPELSLFLKSITRGTSGVFSYSKCDSFALALTFWDALLPPSHKFIGSTLNHDMSAFSTQSLVDLFPVPLFSLTPPQPQAVITAAQDDVSHTANILQSVMIGMMNPDKTLRLSATDAISALRH
ncbi:tetratricopeptide repeat protein [Pelomyxa schiedti]|nr:tetratricopeptide repeat protein [Pelomyxa schiedti]